MLCAQFQSLNANSITITEPDTTCLPCGRSSRRFHRRRLYPMCGHLAGWARPGEHRVMIGNRKSGLLLRNVRRKQRDRDIDIHQHTANCALNVVVTFYALVESARLIGEGQFLDQTMLGEKMKCSVDGAIGNRRISSPHALEDLARGKMPGRRLDLGLDDRSLRGVAIGCLRGQSHCVTFRSAEMARMDRDRNESYSDRSYLRMSLVPRREV